MPITRTRPAAFGRLCVETTGERYTLREPLQPPSGGCVLKPKFAVNKQIVKFPAAFGRLCVETTTLSPKEL